MDAAARPGPDVPRHEDGQRAQHLGDRPPAGAAAEHRVEDVPPEPSPADDRGGERDDEALVPRARLRQRVRDAPRQVLEPERVAAHVHAAPPPQQETDARTQGEHRTNDTYERIHERIFLVGPGGRHLFVTSQDGSMRSTDEA